MHHLLVYAQIIQAEREREIEEAIRRLRLLRRQDETREPVEGVSRLANRSRALNPDVRPSGG